MKVAVHVGQLLQPVPGGIGRYVQELVEALPGAGVETHAFAAGGRPPAIDGEYTDLGFPTGPVRYELWHRLRRPVVRVPGDVVHAPSLAVPPPGPRPLVVTVHDLVFLRQPEHLTKRGVAFHRRGLDLARREAAAVVVPTQFGCDDLAREGFDPAVIHVAPHGVRPPPTPVADPSADLDRLGVRPPYLLFVGTIEPRKGVADLVEAHARLQAGSPELSLVLAGPEGWGPLPDLDRPGIVRLGPVDDDGLDALYRAAVALALPSRYEGFGFTVVEAMARGCPVVSSDAACLPEVAGGASLLVPVGDVGALTDALGGLLADDGARAGLAKAGRARADDFTWAASAAAHAAAYTAALDR